MRSSKVVATSDGGRLLFCFGAYPSLAFSGTSLFAGTDVETKKLIDVLSVVA
jgi:hypothetical protein